MVRMDGEKRQPRRQVYTDIRKKKRLFISLAGTTFFELTLYHLLAVL